MAQTTLSIRMDENLKKQFETLCDELGMNMTTAVCIFAKKAVREQGIPFDVSLNDPFYSPENWERLKRSALQMEQTGGTVHEVNLDD